MNTSVRITLVKHFLCLQGIRVCWCKKCEPSTTSHERTSSEKGWRIQHCSATLSVGTNGCSRFVAVICIEVQGTNELNNSQVLSHSIEKKRFLKRSLFVQFQLDKAMMDTVDMEMAMERHTVVESVKCSSMKKTSRSCEETINCREPVIWHAVQISC